MFYNIMSEFKLIQFYFKQLTKYKIFPNAKKKNLLLSFVTDFISIILLLISFIPMLFVVAVYLTVYLIVGLLIALLVICIISLFGEINKELWGSVISLAVASIGILITLINYTLTSRKSFSENKRNVYINLYGFLYSQIESFKQGKKMGDIQNLPEVTMYSSNIVLRFLNRIKEESFNLEKDINRKQVIDKTVFLIDYMRNEIRERGNSFTFYDYSFTDLKPLCDGDLDENDEEDDIIETIVEKSQTINEQKEIKKIENKPKKSQPNKKTKGTTNETKV